MWQDEEARLAALRELGDQALAVIARVGDGLVLELARTRQTLAELVDAVKHGR